MRSKWLAVVISLLLLVLLIPPVEAHYSLGISGNDAYGGIPYTAQDFSGQVKVSLGETSIGQLSMEVVATGDIANWTEFLDKTSFNLLPGESRTLQYIIHLPETSPGTYIGAIDTVGTPKTSSEGDGPFIVGKPVVGLTITVDVPSAIRILDLAADKDGASCTIHNSKVETFSGTIWYNVTHITGTHVDSKNESINGLKLNERISSGVTWATPLDLGEIYTVNAYITDLSGAVVDDENLTFRVPTPADIIQVWHSPDIVYSDTNVSVFAKVRDSNSDVRLHYLSEGESQQDLVMDYDSSKDVFQSLIPAHDEGKTVEYWVTSTHGQYGDESDHYRYFVYPADTPDLVLTGEDVSLVPEEPRVGDKVNVVFVVMNTGRGEATNVPVRFYIGENEVDEKVMMSIPAQGSKSGYFTWEPVEEGSYHIRLFVDPDNTILEIDEGNNGMAMDVEVGPPPPPPEPETWFDILSDFWLPILLVIIITAVFIFLLVWDRKRHAARLKKLEELERRSEGRRKSDKRERRERSDKIKKSKEKNKTKDKKKKGKGKKRRK